MMTLLTGDAFFPGGMGEFHAPANEFLVFEDGPSVDIVLQWATYRDASDQTSLSRIWGGIHPPADDIPGRIIGEKIGVDAFQLAERYFLGTVTSIESSATTRGTASIANLYPNPVGADGMLTIELDEAETDLSLRLFNIKGQAINSRALRIEQQQEKIKIDTTGLSSGVYLIRIKGESLDVSHRFMVVR